MPLYACRIRSPLGPLAAVVDGQGKLVALRFVEGGSAAAARAAVASIAPGAVWNTSHCEPVAAQLRQYFLGQRKSFTLELAEQGTPFQQRVWQAVRRIPYGQTRTYGELA